MLDSKENINKPSTKKDKASNKKLKKARKMEKRFSKNSISILRTTLRNNIDLTSIADNKANVLLSLNAIMLTFLVPITIPYFDDIIALRMVYPLIILIATCMITVYLSVLVLRPGKFSGQEFRNSETYKMSPFFFGNFSDMTRDQYILYSGEVLKNEELVKQFLSNDFYYIGLRLSQKMKLIRKAFTIFIVGLAISITLVIILLFV